MTLHLVIRAFTLADALGLTDPDVTWLPPYWVCKACVFLGFC